MKKRLLYCIAREVGILIIALFLLSIGVFFTSRIVPGDPLFSYYGEKLDSMSAKEIESCKKELDLNKPVIVQYGKWVKNFVKGEYGISYKYKIPVKEVISPLLLNTFLLGAGSYIMIFIFAILLGVYCAKYEGLLFDKIVCKIGVALYYTPAFWLGIILILIFSVNLGILPSSGAYDTGMGEDLLNRIRHLILPLAVMVFSHLWYYGYLIRNRLLDEVRKDYVALGVMKGLSNNEIIWKHCMKNVLPTIITLMAISVPHILSGTYIAEAVFRYKGIGFLAVESTKLHDYNLLMIIVMATGVLVLVSSFIGRLINGLIDSRMKVGEDIFG